MSDKSTVAVVRGDSPGRVAQVALDSIGLHEMIKGKRVFVKLNFGGPSDKKGAIVSAEVTRAVLEYLKRYSHRVVAGEQGRASRKESEALFNRTFARRMEEETKIQFLNLWDDEYVTVEVPHPLARKEWQIPRSVHEADVVISLACLKVSAAADVTLAMKNFFGIIPVKNKAFLHGKIHEVIVDLNQIVKPAIGIIDAIHGWEGGESAVGGSPVDMGLVMASRDIVALDAVATEIMDRRAEDILHIRKAAELGLGTSDLHNIEIVGEKIEDVRRHFEDVPAFQKWGGRSSLLSGIGNALFILKGEE